MKLSEPQGIISSSHEFSMMITSDDLIKEVFEAFYKAVSTGEYLKI